MPEGRGRAARFALSAAVATALVCATFGAVASSALAWGDSDRDSYTANISPASAPAGKTTTFDVALTNTSSPGSGLVSAAILPPLGFWVSGASLPTGASGRVHVFFNIVLLDHLNLRPGSTLHVSVKATAPSRCNSPFSRWFTDANEGGFFSEDLRLDSSSSSLTTPVTCVVAAGLKFINQPADTLVGSAITTSAYDPSSSPVTVELVDSGGNLVNTTGTPVTVAVGTNPGKANLGGTTTQKTVNGVATFNDLTLDQPDNGYKLTAASSGLTNDTSSAFNENDQAKTCTAGSDCTGTITSGSGSLQVDIGNPGTNSTLTLSKDIGTPMDGAGSNTDNGCGSYSPPPGSTDWYEFVEQPTDNETFDAKTITWTVDDSRNGEIPFQVCFGAPYDFQTGFGADGQQIFAPAGTLPDGSSGFIGLLDTCSDLGERLAAINPCVSSLTSFGDIGTQATIAIPPGLQGDPWAGR